MNWHNFVIAIMSIGALMVFFIAICGWVATEISGRDAIGLLGVTVVMVAIAVGVGTV